MSVANAFLALGRRQHEDGGPMVEPERAGLARRLTDICAHMGLQRSPEDVDAVAVKFATAYDALDAPRPSPASFLADILRENGR